MIIQQVPDFRPQQETGQAAKIKAVTKAIPTAPLDPYCLCDLGLKECNYTEPAFYGGSNEYENDYTSIFVNKADQSDIIKFYLINVENEEEAELVEIEQGLFGEYFDNETFTGVRVDFDLLHSSFNDLRKVKFKIEQTVFGTEIIEESHEFELIKWSLERANGTVRIETINSGRIESGNDYDTYKWKRSVRLQGFFGRETPTINTDNYQDGERRIKQIQDSITNEYTLETELIPNQIFKGLIFNDMLANEIFISDYNIKNANYKGVAVAPLSVSSNYYEKNVFGSYEITFTDRKQNIVKRNK